MEPVFDVIIVGGRPAGSSLALRLGRAGLRVLLLEKARLDQQPPLSLPFLMNSSMQILDELGLNEADYAGDAPKLRRFYLHFRDCFRTHLSISAVGSRDYVYVVDRVRLDGSLWRLLSTVPSVTAIERATFVDVLRDAAGAVCGVRYRDPQGQPQQASAPWVVGADGRFSLVARKVGAQVTLSHPERSTSALYTFWSGVRPYEARGDEPTAVQIYASCDGYSGIVMPTTDGRCGVVLQGRADRFGAQPGQVSDYYLAGLRRMAPIWDRMDQAKTVAPIYGLKRIGNLFRQAGGPGWLLVGDAYHQKDFIDAQGIYDALLTSRILAACLVDWHGGRLPASQVVERYGTEAFAATHPMFLATLDRLSREIYATPPRFIVNTLLRTLMTSPVYMARFSKLISRQIDPQGWAPPGFLIGALLKNLPAVLTGQAGKEQ